DETVVEVETDKAVVEIPSPFAGVVLHHGAAEGEIVEVGQILVVVGEEGETWPEDGGSVESNPPVEDTAPAVSEPEEDEVAESAPIVGTLVDEAEQLPRSEERRVGKECRSV